LFVESFSDLSRTGFGWEQTIFVNQHDLYIPLSLGGVEV
jgi:hypothetical protein